ncbi:MAG: CAP domain-containing protein [Candidatus Sericytochromatia bacterium]|nr:CAP domain-containing protein [Candidatus Sericytochromatia bacterium]
MPTAIVWPTLLAASLLVTGCREAAALAPVLVGVVEVLADEGRSENPGGPAGNRREDPTPATEPPDDPAGVPYVPRWTEAEEPGEPALEALVVRYTNEARATEGLPPLAPRPALHVAARQHSREMLALDYFAHEAPVAAHRTPSQRVRLAGYWAGAAENIYDFRDKATPEETARALVDGWMKSPGHRRNILAENLHLGVGVHHRGNRLMATQVFGKQALDVSRLTLAKEPEGVRVRVVARAEPGARFRSCTVRVNERVVSASPIPFAPGETFRFSALVPSGGSHALILNMIDPADGGRLLWPTPLVTIDTAQPLEQAVTPRAEVE